MIRKTFCILPRVGIKKEQSIWSQGIHTWKDFLENDVKGISRKNKLLYNRLIQKANEELWKENSSYFIKIIPSPETWRLYNFFKDQCCFVDIEGNNIIGIYDGVETKTLIRHINFDRRLLKKELEKYKLIITYNGGAYDLPKIKKYFDFLPNIPHIDLKTACRRCGLTGGLKAIEKKLNIDRPSHLYGSAADCYRAFLASGRREYLEGIVEYNEQDCVSLKPIMDHCYSKLSRLRD